MLTFLKGESLHKNGWTSFYSPEVRERGADRFSLQLAHLPPEDENEQREWPVTVAVHPSAGAAFP